jgi:hypothetical protein
VCAGGGRVCLGSGVILTNLTRDDIRLGRIGIRRLSRVPPTGRTPDALAPHRDSAPGGKEGKGRDNKLQEKQ